MSLLPASGASQVTCPVLVKMAAAKRKRGGANAAPKKKVKFVENGEKGEKTTTEQEPSKEITVPPPVSQVRV